MQLQGLSDKQAQGIFTISQICGIDFAQARKLLEKTDFNVEQATQLHFNPQPEPVHHEPVYHEPVYQNIPQQYGNPGDYYQDQFDENQDPGYTRYRNFRYSGTNFESKYPLNSGTGIKGVFNWVANKFKGETLPGERFIQRIENTFPGTNKIKFQKGTFLQAIYNVRKQKFPLIVVLHDFSEKYNLLFKTLISNPNIAQFFNVTFRVIGFDTTTYEMEQELKKRIDQKNIPCIAVFKVDECEQIAVMDIIQLTPDMDLKELKKRLNGSKSKYIKDEIRQSEYQKKFTNQMNGIYDSNPMTFQKKLQLVQERRIKQMQEKELKESNKQLQIKKKQQELTREKQRQKQMQGARILEQRKTKKQNMKTYNQGIRFRLRLPNGNQVQLTAPSNEKVQYLFEYVDTIEDIGFQQNIWRKFDIIRPYDKLTLGGVRSQTLQEVFGETDSESLFVNQL